MQNIWRAFASLSNLYGDRPYRGLLTPCGSRFPLRASAPRAAEEKLMQDILWIAAIVGLLAATLAYVRLCDHA